MHHLLPSMPYGTQLCFTLTDLPDDRVTKFILTYSSLIGEPNAVHLHFLVSLSVHYTTK